MVPAASGPLPRVGPYSGTGSGPFPLRLRACHPLSHAFPDAAAEIVSPKTPALTPQRDDAGCLGLFRVRSPLLTESLLLSFPPGSEMFQFPGLAACAYGFNAGRFGHPGLNARLTAPPGFSQSSTPFFASWRQDIPHTPLVA